jgi:aryl-alcohol dehydrogenase-like predicted oxidoreductase
MEREIIPMCESEGLAIAPWGVLGRGQFRSAEDYGREGRKMGPQDETHRRMGAKLNELAAKKNTLPTSIALAYVMQKAPYVFPVIGGRKIDQLKSNIEALSVELRRRSTRSRMPRSGIRDSRSTLSLSRRGRSTGAT